MGATIKIFKGGFEIDANGIPQIEDAIGTKASMNFKNTFININIRNVPEKDNVEYIELASLPEYNQAKALSSFC